MTIPTIMTAALLTGFGGFEKLEVCRVPVPTPGPDEVLIRVAAAGVNNTDINTRKGWYAPSVHGGTDAETNVADDASGAWSGRLTFPRIQGADVVGRIEAVGSRVPAERVSERVLVSPLLRDRHAPDDRSRMGYLGSERDGGFAEYVAVPAVNAHAVASDLSDAELATFPCAYSTAENMLTRIALKQEDTLLVTGASGGVGSALVQLAKRRGATVLAAASKPKQEAVAAIGADKVIGREAAASDALDELLGEGGVTAVADVVGGEGFAHLVKALAPGGRYVAAGAIAGPVVALDLRQLYLKDLVLHGTMVYPPDLFGKLVGYIETGQIRPLLAGTFPLAEIHKAQTTFLAKERIGNYVLIP